jgi:hypothetical protein
MVTGFGENQDKWIPNPFATTSLQLSMYAFVGKLMGIAIRGKHMLNLDLPSIVWKQLVGAELNLFDLEGAHCTHKLYSAELTNFASQQLIAIVLNSLKN